MRTFTIQELKTLLNHATGRERVFMLLALNCGFTQADIGNLRWPEIDLEDRCIQRVREKTEVAGRWRVWPETLEAIRWWNRQVKRDPQHVICVSPGKMIRRQLISNAWNKLLNRVTERGQEVQQLSFKHLRKTGAQLVRDVADGETASVYLAHGHPVAEDPLAGVYSNPCFARVADALERVREHLEPALSSVAGTWRESRAGSQRRDPEKIRLARQLDAQGVPIEAIAQALDVATHNVYPYLDREKRKPRASGRRLTERQRSKIRKLRAQGMPIRLVAEKVGCSLSTVSRVGAETSAN